MRGALCVLLLGCHTTTASFEDASDTTPATDTTGSSSLGGEANSTGSPASCEALTEGEEGPFLEWGARVSGTRRFCASARHAMSAPEGTLVELGLLGWEGEGTAQVEVQDWNGGVLARGSYLEPDDRLEFEFPWSGEVLIEVGPDVLTDAENSYELGLLCLENCDHSGSRYPLVLMHGMAGTDAWLNVLEYWWEVPEHLEAHGFSVHAPAVDPFQPPEVRAAQWRAHLDDLHASGQARRFHLYGHSQGGLDARWLTTHLDPEAQVQSVTTMATPHRGSLTVDGIYGWFDLSIFGDEMIEALASLYADWVGADTDQEVMEQLESMTTVGAATFNLETPDRPDVDYASWAGVTCGVLDLFCRAEREGEVVFAGLTVSQFMIGVLEGENDGLVSVESAIWGEFLGEVPADHLDEVGHLFGQTDAFDHLAFYLDEAERLASLERVTP